MFFTETGILRAEGCTMSKKRRQRYIEVPKIGEPLEDPNFVTPTALTDPRNYGTEPFSGAPVFPERDDR